MPKRSWRCSVSVVASVSAAVFDSAGDTAASSFFSCALCVERWAGVCFRCQFASAAPTSLSIPCFALRIRIHTATAGIHPTPSRYRCRAWLEFPSQFPAKQKSASHPHGFEMHAFLGDLAQLRQRENLETAAVGQNRPIPVHERVQSTKVPKHIEPRPDKQVIGIRQNNLRPSSPSSLELTAFTLPASPPA